MSILWILFLITLVWLVFKIGFQTLKWMLILAVLIAAYWILTNGGRI